MKRQIHTILALIYTCHMAHAGTIAAVTVTLQEGDEKPIVAKTTVDLDDRVTLPILFPDRRVWSCEIRAKSSGDQLHDSVHVFLSDRSRPVVAEAGLPFLELFSGQIRGDFNAGDKVVVFQSGDTTVEMEIRPVTGAGGKPGVREPTAAPAPEPKAERDQGTKQRPTARP
ncbi:MAG: hypothetical protein ACR2RV_01645 [Verrucomicrobiales bacterium]